jgi:hypothetical protein
MVPAVADKSKLKAMDDAIAAILKDPEKFKKQLREETKQKNPEMTEEQLDAAVDVVAHQFGL